MTRQAGSASAQILSYHLNEVADPKPPGVGISRSVQDDELRQTPEASSSSTPVGWKRLVDLEQVDSRSVSPKQDGVLETPEGSATV